LFNLKPKEEDVANLLDCAGGRTNLKTKISYFDNLINKLFFRYEIVKPEKIDQALELLYATYHPDEPLTKHLGKHRGGIFSLSVYMYLT
jgi:hypothetical protein